MDPLTELLSSSVFRASVFFDGHFCGDNVFSGDGGLGQLHIVRSGTVVMHHEDRLPICITEPAVVFYPRGLRHSLTVLPGGDATLLCANLAFEGGGQNTLARVLPDLVHIRLTEAPSLGHTLALLFEEAQTGGSGRQLVLDRLCEVLTVQILRHAHASGQLDPARLSGLKHPGLARVLEAVHRNPEQPWPLDALARLAGMSRSKFAACFHSLIGTPPAEYVIGRRMTLARQLLGRRLPVEQVAHRVGYQSQPAFSRAFISRMGVSPSAWQRAQAG